MAAIWTSKQPWLRKPQGPIQLNWAAPYADGVWGAWPVTENTGQRLRDVGPNRNDVIATSAPTLAMTDQGVGMTQASPVYTNTALQGKSLMLRANATMAAWVFKPTLSAAAANVIYVSNNAISRFHQIYQRDVGPAWRGFHIYSGNYTTGDMVLGWNHIVLSLATDNAYLYINGRFIMSGVPTLAPDEAMTRLVIGDGGDTNTIISDLRIYTPHRAQSCMVDALYNPRTRWELYQPVPQRTWFDAVAGSGGTTYNDTLAFGVSAGVSQSAAAVFAGSLALATSAGLNNAGPRIGSNNLALGAAAGLTPASLASLLGTLQLSTSLSLSPAANLIQAIALSLGISAGTAFYDFVVGGGSTYNELLALDASLGLTPGTAYVTQALATYATQVGLTPAGTKVTAVTASYGVSATMAQSATRVLVNTLTLQITADIARVTQLATSGLVSLGMNAGVIAQTTATFQNTLTLAVAGLFTAISREFVFADPYLFPSSAAQSTLADRLQTPLTEVESPTTALQQAVTEFVAVTSRLSEN